MGVRWGCRRLGLSKEGLWSCPSLPNSLRGPYSDSQVDDMDVDLDKEFLQDLKELKVLVADKDLLDLHKR